MTTPKKKPTVLDNPCCRRAPVQSFPTEPKYLSDATCKGKIIGKIRTVYFEINFTFKTFDSMKKSSHGAVKTGSSMRKTKSFPIFTFSGCCCVDFVVMDQSKRVSLWSVEDVLEWVQDQYPAHMNMLHKAIIKHAISGTRRARTRAHPK